MDWELIREGNAERLRGILAMLLAMAGLADSRKTLPRRLHRAILRLLRLLRPAESAARRLIVVAARGLVVTLPPARPHNPKPKPVAPVLRSLGIAVTMSPAEFARAEAERAAAAARLRNRRFSLPLFDPPPRSFRVRPVYTPAHAAPRISVPGYTDRHRLPPPPSPDDPLDATRLGLRLRAVGAVLDDLPAAAMRFARWRARAAAPRTATQAARRPRRLSPLKLGRPPGWRKTSRHDVDDVLKDLHYFAREELADTS